ncbi:hypothetical protein [Reyranella sp.]|uniref:hypothetical protein n=1 Tax=Reyranella sp. TaxID=1929291 RepID=UPI003F70E18B
MNLEDQIVRLQAKNFGFDCVKMSLAQSTTTSPILFEGKGYIRQNLEDQFEFKIYPTKPTSIDWNDWCQHKLSANSGKLFQASDYFSLAITDESGGTWTASNILPDCNWLIGHRDPVVVFGKLHSLNSTQQSPITRNYLKLIFFDEVELPYNQMVKSSVNGRISTARHQAKFSAANCNFLVSKQDFGFIVEATSDSALPEYLQIRIEETFQYLLARSVACRSLVRHTGQTERIEFLAGRATAKGTRLGPPLSSATPAFIRDGWLLFSKYLEYLLRSTTHPYWSHCSYHLYNAREVSAGTLDSWAVGVSVAVEGIANLLEAPSGCHGRRETKEFIKEVQDRFSGTVRFEHFKTRLSGLLGTLLNTRPEDRLSPLAASNRVSGDYIEAWRRLRNKHVHPRQVDLKNLTLDNHQELIDLVHQTTVLLYQIIFHLIEYEGQYTDYASEGWPSKNYPLSVQ